MKGQAKNFSIWLLLLVSMFLISGCYTQLAKPEFRTEERIYIEEDSEYTDEESYQDSYITHRYVYYSYYPGPFYFYYSHNYYPISYRYSDFDFFFSGVVGFFFSGGCYRNSYSYGHSYVHFPTYYSGGHHGVVTTIPREKRGFTRRGTRNDDFGYRLNRTSVNRSISLGSQSGVGTSFEGSSRGSLTRRKGKDSTVKSGRITRNSSPSVKKDKLSRRRRTRDLDNNLSRPVSKPASNPKSDDDQQLRKRRSSSGKSKSGTTIQRKKKRASKQPSKKNVGSVKKRSSGSNKARVSKRSSSSGTRKR